MKVSLKIVAILLTLVDLRDILQLVDYSPHLNQ